MSLMIRMSTIVQGLGSSGSSSSAIASSIPVINQEKNNNSVFTYLDSMEGAKASGAP